MCVYELNGCGVLFQLQPLIGFLNYFMAVSMREKCSNTDFSGSYLVTFDALFFWMNIEQKRPKMGFLLYV